MDLERMNVELYERRYLTLDDFLDDIRKIVHNVTVRINKDPETAIEGASDAHCG